MNTEKIDYTKTMDFESVIIDRFDHDCDLYDMREWADDIELIRLELKTINIHTSHYICYRFWQGYSYDMSAGWLMQSKGEVIGQAKYYMRNTNER